LDFAGRPLLFGERLTGAEDISDRRWRRTSLGPMLSDWAATPS
jgi:hypothetical protein